MTQLALITGASSGIGRAFARRLAADGTDLIAVGRRADRLAELAASLPDVAVEPLVADLTTDDGLAAVADACAGRPLTLLVNNAGVGNYVPMSRMTVAQADAVARTKLLAPSMLVRAAAPGMSERGAGTIVNVSGMLAFGGPATGDHLPAGRSIYTGSLAYLVSFSQTLADELGPAGVRVQALCPGIVDTEFVGVPGADRHDFPMMSADDVVTACLRGLELGEVVCTPGVEDRSLIDAVFAADLAAFTAQSPELASRYRPR